MGNFAENLNLGNHFRPPDKMMALKMTVQAFYQLIIIIIFHTLVFYSTHTKDIKTGSRFLLVTM